MAQNLGRIRGSFIFNGNSTSSNSIKAELTNLGQIYLDGDYYVCNSIANHPYFIYEAAHDRWLEKGHISGLPDYDGSLSPTSMNAVQNSVITQYINSIMKGLMLDDRTSIPTAFTNEPFVEYDLRRDPNPVIDFDSKELGANYQVYFHWAEETINIYINFGVIWHLCDKNSPLGMQTYQKEMSRNEEYTLSIGSPDGQTVKVQLLRNGSPMQRGSLFIRKIV